MRHAVPPSRNSDPSDVDPYAHELTTTEIEQDRHRDFVGGRWNEIGELQLEFLRKRGLSRAHHLVDIGCGALRGGIHFIHFLEPGHYFGVDRNASLLRAGLEVEVPRAVVGNDTRPTDLGNRIEPEQLAHTEDFDFAALGPRKFEFALAHSVFTHTRVEALQRCLVRLTDRIEISGEFYVSYFAADPNLPPEAAIARGDSEEQIETYTDRDPYHHRLSDLAACAGGLPWRATAVGDWGHPRGQRMLCFTRC